MNRQSKLKHVDTSKAILSQLKRIYQIRKTARFWFGSLLAISQQISLPNLEVDCNQQQTQLLLAMLSYAVSDMTSFYQSQVPQQVYHLLQIIQYIYVKIEQGQTKLCRQNYHITMQKLYHYNILGVLMMKNKRYSVAKNCFEHIIQKYETGSIQTISQFFMSAFNNYLFLIKTTPEVHTIQNNPKHEDDQRIKILQLIQKLVLQLTARALTRQNITSNQLLLILSVFNQHEVFFSEQTKVLCLKLFQKNRNSEMKRKKSASSIASNQLPSLSSQKQSINIQRLLLKKFVKYNQSTKVATMKMKSKQLGFFVRFNKSINRKESSRLRQSKQSRLMKGIQLETLHGQMIMNDEIMKTPKKQPLHIRKAHKINEKKQPHNSTILITQNQTNTPQNKRFDMVQSQIIKPIIQKSPNLQNNHEMTIYKDFIKSVKKPVVLKNSFVLLRYVSQGIVLENYLSEKQKFLTWDDISTLMKNLRISSLFHNAVPVGVHYQLSQILINYLYKKQATYDNKRTISMSNIPNQLTHINELMKIYKLQGPYLKLLVMNHYDTKHIQFELNFYIDDFDHYFKKVKSNEYIQWLNSLLVTDKVLDSSIVNMEQFTNQLYRKNKLVSKDEIQNQLRINQVRESQYLKSSKFNLAIIMKNNKRIFLTLDHVKDRQDRNPFNIVFKIINLNSSNQKSQNLFIPYYKFIKYFPLPKVSQKQLPSEIVSFIRQYGLYVIQPYLHCFQNYPHSLYLKQNMLIKTYEKKIEMVKQGRYYSPVSAQIIGTEQRILGIIFRQYQQSQIRQVITLVFNQYYNFMISLLTLKTSNFDNKTNRIIERLLYNRSVKQTINLFKKENLRGTMVGMFKYLSMLPSQYAK